MNTRTWIERINEQKLLISLLSFYLMVLPNAIAQLLICEGIDIQLGLSKCADGSDVSPYLKWISIVVFSTVMGTVSYCYLTVKYPPNATKD